ncbi:hypothetical protein PV336_16250 [Streptomyces sp. MI02-2A]|uniref:hypothetical protein n=1 Tax=Streptomyces sp. MI02-2A TaxID=3028688 RepID=UPI0029BBF4C0|nr:hypothetical protein [Streptomyces sp. MI02-2A]MDX3260773.1 hypothetical protein [Streptomyces sp. MI02-2A]
MSATPVTTLADDHDGWTSTLTAEEFEATREKFDKINERAARKGLAGTLGLAYRVVEETETNALGFKVTKVFYETTITGDAPKHNGWEFIATLDYDPNAGLVVNTYPGVQNVDRENLREGWCDHCKTTRARAKTFLVRNEETGEQVQVGTSCIKDFTGWNASVVWLDADKAREISGWGGGDYAPDFTPETVLAVAWAVIKLYGYQRSNNWGDPSTAGHVRTVLYPSPKSKLDREFAEKIRPLAEEAQERAEEIRAFILSDDFAGDSEYVLNLKSIAAGKLVTRRYIGILASAPQAWARHNERTLIRQEKESNPSVWIGTAPDKANGVKGSRITFTGIIETLRWITGDYGVTTLYQVRDELSGVIVKWFASSDALGDKKGARVTFRGTVKAHEEYQGTKTTVLTRCTLVEMDVAEPKAFEIDAPKKATKPRKKVAPAAPVQEPESVQGGPKTESQTVPNQTPQVEQIGKSEQTESESAPEANQISATNDVDLLDYYAGGHTAIARRIADDAEHYARMCRLVSERHHWVRLGDGTAERMTIADAWDLLGQAHAEGATWDAATVNGNPKVSAVVWDGLSLAVGPDGDAPTV